MIKLARIRAVLVALTLSVTSVAASAAITDDLFGISTSGSDNSSNSSKPNTGTDNGQRVPLTGFNYSGGDVSAAALALQNTRFARQQGSSGGMAPSPVDVAVMPQAPNGMFGSQLFGGTFHNSRGTGFNPGYQVSIGDSVTLRMWGAFAFDGQLVVDPQGNIFVPNVGPVTVAGVRNADLNGRVLSEVRKVYKANVNVYASLLRLT